MQSSLLDPMEDLPSSGKTSPAYCPTEAMRSAASWEDLSAHWTPYHLPEAEAGPVKVWCRGHGHGRHGPFLTRNGSEWRSGAVACSLSSILETGPIDSRYFLSATACAGILRRAEKLGKVLPEQLLRALKAVVDSERISNAPEDCSR